MHDGSRTRIGLCGLGQMGLAVATRLATAFDVIAVDVDPARRALADAIAGVSAVEALTEVAEQSTIVLSLPAPPISLQVCSDLAGMLASGALVIETSTVLRRDTIGCAAVLAPAGVAIVDAAILSGVGQMASGAATLLVGGDDADVARAQPVLDVLGSSTQRFGGLGAGMAAKVVNNAVAHAVMVVLVEGFAMAKSQGLDVGTIAEMLAGPDGGLIRPLTHRMMQRVAHGDFDGGMPLDAARKDSTLALAMAQDGHVPLFATQAAHTVYDLAVARGLGRADYSVLATLWEQWGDMSLAYRTEAPA